METKKRDNVFFVPLCVSFAECKCAYFTCTTRYLLVLQNNCGLFIRRIY